MRQTQYAFKQGCEAAQCIEWCEAAQCIECQSGFLICICGGHDHDTFSEQQTSDLVFFTGHSSVRSLLRHHACVYLDRITPHAKAVGPKPHLSKFSKTCYWVPSSFTQ